MCLIRPAACCPVAAVVQCSAVFKDGTKKNVERKILTRACNV